MYFNGMFNLEGWNDSADYAIFDDWDDWNRFTQYKQWLGAQSEFTVTDKYKRKCTKSWGKPTIILSNSQPTFSDYAWVAVNCVTYNLGPNEKFY